jgi:hypothetical protein
VLRILDVYSGSRIPDPKTATKERGAKNICIFFVATNITQLKTILFLNCGEKKWGQFTKSYRTEALKNDRVRIQGSKRHLIPDPDGQH